MTGWRDDELAAPQPSVWDWLRILWRGGLVGGLVYAGLAVLLVVRLVERPLFGMARPWTPQITRVVCRGAIWLLGLGYSVTGRPMRQRGAIVANHSSWLDIFVLNACQSIYFVAKSEVEHWAAIGWLARATGTVFIARKSREAKAQQAVFEERLRAGHKLLFFPGGHQHGCGAGAAVQINFVRGVLHAWSGSNHAYSTGYGDVPCAHRGRSALLWLVGGDGVFGAFVEGSGDKATGAGRGDLSSRGAGGRF